MKIAIFGDCISKGCNSYYFFEEDKLKGGCLSNEKIKKCEYFYNFIKNIGRIPISDNIKSISENVDDYSQTHSAISFGGCFKPNYEKNVDTKISVVYKILNNDLSKYDVIIIFCCVNDYRHNNLIGAEEERTPFTINGAYNIIMDELKKKYPTKKVIFILPSYIKDRKNYITFEEFFYMLKDKIIRNGYDYISFYEHIKNFIDEKYYWKILFPDGCHPSLDLRLYMNDWIKKELIKKIPKE